MTGNGDSNDYVEVDVLLPAELAELVRAEARATGREPGDVIADVVSAFLARRRSGEG